MVLTTVVDPVGDDHGVDVVGLPQVHHPPGSILPWLLQGVHTVRARRRSLVEFTVVCSVITRNQRLMEHLSLLYYR